MWSLFLYTINYILIVYQLFINHISLPHHLSIKCIFIDSNPDQEFLYLSGLIFKCFLKKLLKCVTSPNPRANAISETLHTLCLRSTFASWRIRSAIIFEVVFIVTSLTALFRWLTWIFNWPAKSEAERRLTL